LRRLDPPKSIRLPLGVKVFFKKKKQQQQNKNQQTNRNQIDRLANLTPQTDDRKVALCASSVLAYRRIALATGAARTLGRGTMLHMYMRLVVECECRALNRRVPLWITKLRYAVRVCSPRFRLTIAFSTQLCRAGRRGAAGVRSCDADGAAVGQRAARARRRPARDPRAAARICRDVADADNESEGNDLMNAFDSIEHSNSL
jgi:hypothetical protein